MSVSAPEGPNVVVVVADQFRAAAPDSPAVETPTLDAFADRNVAFRRAYSSTPACGPARGPLLTGLYPHSHRVIDTDHRLSARVPPSPYQQKNLAGDPDVRRPRVRSVNGCSRPPPGTTTGGW